MMMNLFSMFDPSSFSMNSTWLSIIIVMIIMVNNKIKKNFKSKIIIKLIMNLLSMEIKMMNITNLKKGVKKFFIPIFLSLFFLNFSSLFPFIFTPTAHISISIPLAFSMWMSIMMFGWMSSTKKMLIHLTPKGTPNLLMNFMVLIEMISNLIRPITLSIRLSANMIAGHLLMLLLSNIVIASKSLMMSSFPTLMILTTLEMAVSMIQAYVFMTLLSLYSTEIY